MTVRWRSQRPAPALSRRDFVKLGSSAALAGTAAATSPAAVKGRTPNLLLVITDQQHIDTIAAAGCPHVKTPALDRLCGRGLRFTESYSSNPVCSPARSSIFTGRPSSETGVFENGLPIRQGIPNLGQWLAQETNYETVYSGKWHVPSSFTHLIPGFDVLNSGVGGQGNLGDTASSRAAEGYLRNRSRSKPFFLVASFLQPHDICEWLRLNRDNPAQLRYPELADQLPDLPDNFRFDEREPGRLQQTRARNEPAKGGWSERQWLYYRWSYYRHIEMVDAEVGRVLNALDEEGYTDETVIVFTADHGEGMGHHQMVRKSSPYDEASKVPFIISWPGHVPEGRVETTRLVSGMDIVPTLCDYAGIAAPTDTRGQSLRRLIERPHEEWRSFLVTESNNNTGRMLRTERFKYVSYRSDPVEQFFDLSADPGETVNLATQAHSADELARHRRLLGDWERSLDVAPNVPEPNTWRRS